MGDPRDRYLTPNRRSLIPRQTTHIRCGCERARKAAANAINCARAAGSDGPDLLSPWGLGPGGALRGPRAARAWLGREARGWVARRRGRRLERALLLRGGRCARGRLHRVARRG